ncbi:MAG: DUF389 domain-containing protein [Silvanigrellaceae bacterium]
MESVDLFKVMRHGFLSRFSLKDEVAHFEQIAEHLRAGVELKGMNALTLIIAIFIAAIGLNVNSPAVIIGAMLISPLMGPIMGVGFGVSIRDFALVRQSVTNLIIAAVISLLTSSAYFLVTPLREAQSELLARTSPTIWDVAVAFFGGLAGAVAAIRKGHSNVVPGVAIATALMPPLCTAGYGIAHANIEYFLGALYLFSINSVFIAVATIVVLGFLQFPRIQHVGNAVEAKLRRWFILIISVTALPSIFLAYRLVQQEVFRSSAARFVDNEVQSANVRAAKIGIDAQARRIEVTLIGDVLDEGKISGIKRKMKSSGLADADLVIFQGADERVNKALLKEDLLNDLYQKSLSELRERDKRIESLERTIADLSSLGETNLKVANEVSAYFPNISGAVVARGDSFRRKASGSELSSEKSAVQFLVLEKDARLKAGDLSKIERWFRVRMANENAKVIVSEKPQQ